MAKKDDYYKIFFSESPIAQVIIDNNTKIIEANNIAALLFRTNEIIGEKINKFIKNSKKESLISQLQSDKIIEKKVFYTKDGVAVKIKISNVKIKDKVYFNVLFYNYSSEIIRLNKEKKVKEKLEFLYTTAQDFLAFDFSQDIFAFIGNSIRNLIPHAIVVVSYYDKNEDVYIIKNISGIGSKINKLSEAIGVELIGHKVKVDKKIRTNKNLGKLITLNKNDINFNYDSVSNNFYSTARELFMINKHYSVAINNKTELLGNIGIFTRKDDKIDNPELIELFALQAGTAIQKYNLQTELIFAKEKAEESDKLKTAFLSNMSHEIRTPMNTIIGFSEMMAKSDLTNEQREKYYNFVKASSDSLLNLIEDIIDISKIESGQLSIIKSSFKPYLLLKDLLLIHRKELKKSKSAVKISLNVDTEFQDIFVNTDRFRLKQIIDNLIANAIKFTTKGKIEFGFTNANNKLKFYVKDTGKGISKKRQKEIFERFNQDINNVVKGTGLGLSISKQLAQLMGSDLYIESNINKGSKFYFYLDYDVELKNNNNIIKENNITNDWSNKFFLIAEDEDNNYELLKEILMETKAKVVRVENGADAVKYCLEKTPDIVLMDIKMPIMDGFTATSKIIKHNPNIKIIAQTAYAMVGEKEKAINIGCVDFVTKPINRKSLLYKINKFIDANKK